MIPIQTYNISISEQSFDAWGRKRNATNWSYSSIATTPDWLYRGYTSHEYYEELALINMNGRMYDPIIGRMLSVENFVQDNTSTQGYNRYSYALNNPLKYTDPSGEFLMLGALAVFIIGSAIEHTANAKSYGHSTFGESLKGGFNSGMNAFNQINSITSVSIPIGDNLSASVGLSMTGLGVTGGVTYHNDGLSIGVGGGTSFGVNPNTGNTGFGTSYGSNIGYRDPNTGFGLNIGIARYGGNNEAQTTHIGTVHFNRNWSFSTENDRFAGTDHYNTAAWRISYKSVSIGMNIYTTSPPADEREKSKGGKTNYRSMWGDNPHGTYTSGERKYAGFYFGYTSGMTVSRAGVDAPWVQDFMQNGWHRFSGVPYFNTNDGPSGRFYSQDLLYSPWSLYGN